MLIVGGGIVGAGALLDATSRGLRAALIEQDDIASGTSSRSSRLIHGGLRYLEDLRFGLVREALAERGRLLRLAPHLVRLEPFLFPVYGWPLVHRAFYGAGLVLYDLLGAARDGGRAHHLGAGAVARLAPPIRRTGLRGGITYHDGVEDDARLALAVLRTALARGAVAVTRAKAEEPIVDRSGRVTGVRVRDVDSGGELEVRAGAVIDATGVWAGSSATSLGEVGLRLVAEPRQPHRRAAGAAAARGRHDAADPGARALHHPVAGRLDRRHDRRARPRVTGPPWRRATPTSTRSSGW